MSTEWNPLLLRHVPLSPTLVHNQSHGNGDGRHVCPNIGATNSDLKPVAFPVAPVLGVQIPYGLNCRAALWSRFASCHSISVEDLLAAIDIS